MLRVNKPLSFFYLPKNSNIYKFARCLVLKIFSFCAGEPCVMVTRHNTIVHIINRCYGLNAELLRHFLFWLTVTGTVARTFTLGPSFRDTNFCLSKTLHA